MITICCVRENVSHKTSSNKLSTRLLSSQYIEKSSPECLSFKIYALKFCVRNEEVENTEHAGSSAKFLISHQQLQQRQRDEHDCGVKGESGGRVPATEFPDRLNGQPSPTQQSVNRLDILKRDFLMKINNFDVKSSSAGVQHVGGVFSQEILPKKFLYFRKASKFAQ